MKLTLPAIFFHTDKSLLLRERKLLNFLIDRLGQHLLPAEQDTHLNAASTYQLQMNAGYIELLLEHAQINRRAELAHIIDELIEKNPHCLLQGEWVPLIDELTLHGSTLDFSVNPRFNQFFTPENCCTLDGTLHNRIKKKNSLIIYEMIVLHLRKTLTGNLVPDEKGISALFRLSVTEIKNFLGTDTYQEIPTGQFNRTVLKRSLKDLNQLNPEYSVSISPVRKDKTITHFVFSVVFDNNSHNQSTDREKQLETGMAL